ncbi:hypothetical protein TREMEDRAFT_39416 [Tremella mesenterica DSM 1558]|uniref:uncharacterized protein n=1 Tax=Tremella mesenterica (strain ATCC 24925 / CBS 8224 / DSM 1558 / NBRC 9311 / NRRL Y-6157 / RJB 2259-6 / UBC 559-6) TaxID=578456 RepID=UPI0003F492D3|nr:uncharacterized protein TREMEDRAFT_39416 [Tremella mesenterica DSM 1558]EIW69174.1 hypothetical protein TREMEDRAFT_39416 [Tremella mesenterica DSM 1558]
MLILPVERALGNAVYFILMISFLIPASQTVVETLESWTYVAFFAALSWGWLALGIFIAYTVRDPVDAGRLATAQKRYAYLKDNEPLYQTMIINDGTYIQAKSAVVLAVFLAVGSGVLLWVKMRTQPGPMTYPLVIACVLLDVALTLANFQPGPAYTLGFLFFKPMVVQGGLSVLSSILIFPQSISSLFKTTVPKTLDPLIHALGSAERLFTRAGDTTLLSDYPSLKLRSQAWAEESAGIRDGLNDSLSGIAPLSQQQKYLPLDISYGRLSSQDLRQLYTLLVSTQTRSSGLAFFFDMVFHNAKHSHIDSSAYSVYQAARSGPASRDPSIHFSSASALGDVGADNESAQQTPSSNTKLRADVGNLLAPNWFRRTGSSTQTQRLPKTDSRTSLRDYLNSQQTPVGVYESQRYVDIERLFADHGKGLPEHLERISVVSLPLVIASREALVKARDWILHVDRLHEVAPGITEPNKLLGGVISTLDKALEEFRETRREVVRPFQHLFDPIYRGTLKHYRALYQNFVAQYHLIQFTESIVVLLRKMEDLEVARPRKKIWYPRPSDWLRHYWDINHRERASEQGGAREDESVTAREAVEGILGEAIARQPEYDPFRNPTLRRLSTLSALIDPLFSRSFMYAIKAVVLTGVASLPNWFSATAPWYQRQRAIWSFCTYRSAAFAVYAGDTTAAWVARCISSFWGCLIGLVVWYIGNGSGRGNPYGLGAICAVVFPFLSFFRVHFPGSVTIAFLTPISFGIVIGYSWFEGSIGIRSSAAPGWSTAWHRFVDVVVGVTAAWIFAYIPPAFSSKRAIRYTYARSISAAGSIFCDVLSEANGLQGTRVENKELQAKILVWRTKLSKLGGQHNNAAFEYSLRGRWPEERYKRSWLTMLALLLAVEELLGLLSQLHHVLCQMERPWRKALLARTKLSELLFLGDILAVVSMCSTSLRAGFALPQITPAPLIERFRKGEVQGWNLPSGYEDEGVPSIVTPEVLESDDYMRYALGVVTVFAILGRLDRIVVICKTLLGESYHISGLHLEQH